MFERRSINTVRVRLPSGMVALPWDSAQAFLSRCAAGRDDVPRIVDRFRAVGTSRPVALDAEDVLLARDVIDAWAEAEAELPPGIPDLREALWA